MANENRYEITLKESELREVQRAILYHTDAVLIPFLENVSKVQDYDPTDEIRKRIETLQRVMDKLNQAAGTLPEHE